LAEGDEAEAVNGARTNAPKAKSEPNPAGAVFVSYASQDASAAARIAGALRAGGIEVWFDQSELRGGDAWDQSIRKQIKTCALFLPVISRNTHDRDEGYFRLEWKLAIDRSHLMAADRTFLLPVVIDDTREADERVPERFREVQWTRLTTGVSTDAFVERVRRLLSSDVTTSAATSTRSSVLSKASTGVASTRSKVSASRSFVRWIVGGFLFFAVGYIALDKFWLPRHDARERVTTTADLAAPVSASGTPVIPEKSIAVLPFADMSEKKDQEYFSDGLSEELIDRLAQTPGLQVIARTSSFYFKGKQVTIAEIAKTLGVAHVLEGSVRKSGTRLRVTAQLIRADTDLHLWSMTYDRDVRDIFKVQDELAAAVVTALKAKLLPVERLETWHRTGSSEAYDQYLIGKQLLNRSGVGDYRLAVFAYQKAIALDGNFAAAYVGLAEAEAAVSGTETGDRVALQRALDAANRAVALAPDSADGYATRGSLLGEFFWDWSRARADLERAIAYDAGNRTVQGNYSALLSSLGLVREALVAARKAIDADPLSGAAWDNLGAILKDDGQLVAARAAVLRAQQLNPNSFWPPYNLAQIELLDGHPEKALTVAQTMRTPALVTAMAAYTLGRGDEAERALNEILSRQPQIFGYQIAEIYAWRGENDQAFEWLDRSYAQHDPGLSSVKTDPFLTKLRTDRRYAALLRKMNLP
jgi:TolB-like protein